MKNFLLVSFLFLSQIITQAQPWSLAVSLGTANYQGDIVDKPYTFDNSRFAVGFGAEYNLSTRINLKAMLHITSLTADDKDNIKPYLVGRNLNFTTNLTELGITAHFDLLNFDTHNIVPYVFGGMAIFHFNPFTFDSLGAKTYLQPLSTEGQGLTGITPEVKPYSLTQWSIPFGGGFKCRINEMVSISLELGLRKLFFDHIDDVSSTYPDKAVLLAQRGPKAVSLAYRGDELKTNPGTYPVGGTVRGGAKSKDWYYFTLLTASFRLPAKNSANRFNRSSLKCPALNF